MRFSTLALAAAIVAAASFSACKSTTAQGDSMAGAGSMSADAGMMSADGGSMGSTMGTAAGDMGSAAGQAGKDMKQGAETAGHDMAAGAGSMASGAADAGMQAAGAAGSTMKDAAGSAASTASSAAGDMKTGAATAAADTKPAGPTDAQIAAIVVAANTVDINAAKVAMKMSKNAKVRKFARDMVKDHTANNKAAVALVTKLGVTPEENDTSKSLTDGGQKNIDNLKTLKGKEFDKAYVDNEVSYHQAVVDAVDNTLIPNAKNEELKALLTKTSPVIKEHLEHAKMIQSAMSAAK